LCPLSQVEAGIGSYTINKNRAGATFSYLTTTLDTGKAQSVAQSIQKRFTRIKTNLDFFAVYRTFENFVIHYSSAPPLRAASAKERFDISLIS
jgi:hypothetical protein